MWNNLCLQSFACLLLILCGDMSVNPLLLITHCQDENRQLISFWNEYKDQSLVVYVVEVFSHLNVKIKENPKILFFPLTNPRWGLVNHTRRVCPEGVKRPRRVPVEKGKRADNFGLNGD